MLEQMLYEMVHKRNINDGMNPCVDSLFKLVFILWMSDSMFVSTRAIRLINLSVKATFMRSPQASIDTAWTVDSGQTCQGVFYNIGTG